MNLFSLFELRHPSSTATSVFLSLGPLDSDWDLHHQLLWFSGLLAGTGTTPPAILTLQLADVGLLSLRNGMGQFLITSFYISKSLYTLLILFYLRTLTNTPSFQIQSDLHSAAHMYAHLIGLNPTPVNRGKP